MTDLEKLEEKLGFAFKSKELLRQSLAHRSYLNENPEFTLGSNERLEFLGDAVLAYVCAAYLYRQFPDLQEGELTSLRAAAVRAETLAKFAVEIDLGTFLLLGRGESKSGGRTRPLLLSSAFEAVVGAVLVDQGLDRATEFTERFLGPELDLIVSEGRHENFKSRLQELTQGESQMTPVYRTMASSGPDHARTFTVEVTLGKEVLGTGSGHSKQLAQQAAARDAMEHVDRWLPSKSPE